jgi:NADH:ubiquinone oxidoreductase subunit K
VTAVELVTAVLIYVSWGASLLFLVTYLVVARWYRSVVGRHLVALGVTLLLIATLAALSQILGQDYAARPVFRLLVWACTALVTVGLCVALYRAQLTKRK